MDFQTYASKSTTSYIQKDTILYYTENILLLKTHLQKHYKQEIVLMNVYI